MAASPSKSAMLDTIRFLGSPDDHAEKCATRAVTSPATVYTSP